MANYKRRALSAGLAVAVLGTNAAITHAGSNQATAGPPVMQADEQAWLPDVLHRVCNLTTLFNFEDRFIAVTLYSRHDAKPGLGVFVARQDTPEGTPIRIEAGGLDWKFAYTRKTAATGPQVAGLKSAIQKGVPLTITIEPPGSPPEVYRVTHDEGTRAAVAMFDACAGWMAGGRDGGGANRDPQSHLRPVQLFGHAKSCSLETRSGDGEDRVRLHLDDHADGMTVLISGASPSYGWRIVSPMLPQTDDSRREGEPDFLPRDAAIRFLRSIADGLPVVVVAEKLDGTTQEYQLGSPELAPRAEMFAGCLRAIHP